MVRRPPSATEHDCLLTLQVTLRPFDDTYHFGVPVDANDERPKEGRGTCLRFALKPSLMTA